MDERFPEEFVTWHHSTPVGIKVDEVFGMDSRSGKVWLELARQIYCEQGTDYRVIEHFDNGAPFIEGLPARISITHTTHYLAVASLPKTPEINLESFNPRSAMGIDAEPLDRSQVIKVRNKFLSEREIKMIPEEDLQANLLAWTSKEALYKCALQKGLDFKNDIQIIQLPPLCDDPTKKLNVPLGEAIIYIRTESDVENHNMHLYSYVSYGCCVTLAFNPKCAKFSKY